MTNHLNNFFNLSMPIWFRLRAVHYRLWNRFPGAYVVDLITCLVVVITFLFLTSPRQAQAQNLPVDKALDDAMRLQRERSAKITSRAQGQPAMQRLNFVMQILVGLLSSTRR
jgi:hypothetical protein